MKCLLEEENHKHLGGKTRGAGNALWETTKDRGLSE